MSSLLAKIIRGLISAAGKLPLRFHYFMGDILAWLLKNVIHYRSRTVMTNLSRSFPDMKYREIEHLYDEFYRHLGEIFAETVWFGGSSYERLKRSGIVTITNPELISAHFDASPSMTVLSTHCGNWELLGGFLGYRTSTGGGYTFGEKNIKVVYKKLSSEVSDEVFRRNRVNPLVEVGTECEVESSNILRFTLKHKDEKNIYIYPTDQAPYRKAGKHDIGDFMHQHTYAMLGSTGVACRMGHSVLYMKMKRVERGRYEMTFIPLCADASESTPEEIMRKYYDELEKELNETPCNWLWTHKRWK